MAPPESNPAEGLSPTLYVRVRRIAGRLMTGGGGGGGGGRGGGSARSLTPTDLAHAAYVRIQSSGAPVSRDARPAVRNRICALFELAMRSFLIDRARRRLVRQRVDEEHSRRAIQAADEDGFDSTHFSSDIVLQLPELLEELRSISARQAMVFELRAIKGLSVAQAAASLGVSDRTIESDYRWARAWLQGEILRRQSTVERTTSTTSTRAE
jgi:RNA polymerase sigma factor (sigma-70 family)